MFLQCEPTPDEDYSLLDAENDIVGRVQLLAEPDEERAAVIYPVSTQYCFSGVECLGIHEFHNTANIDMNVHLVYMFEGVGLAAGNQNSRFIK